MRTFPGSRDSKASRWAATMLLPLLAFLLSAQDAMADARINAGGPSYVDSSGNSWSADSGYNSGSSVNWGPVAIAGTSDPTLFRTEHYGPNLQYTVAVPNGTYTVRLYFCENWVDSTFPNAGVGFRVFNVQANGATIVPDLDIYGTVGAHVALIKTATVTVSDGQIVFSSSTPAGWMVNAIEVIGLSSAPDTTPPTLPTGLTATPVSATQVSLMWNPSSDSGSGVGGYHVRRNGVEIFTTAPNVTTYIDTGLSPVTQYLYTVSAFDQAQPSPNESMGVGVQVVTPAASSPAILRIKAAGGPYNDSAGNIWSTDTGFSGSPPHAVNWGVPNVTGTSDPALYYTERYGADLKYTFSLPNGVYQVRLYFAENWVDSSFPNGGVGYRVFDVQANGNTVIPGLDVFNESGGTHRALVKSATVNVTNGQLVLSSPQGWFVNAIEIDGQAATVDTTPPTVPTGLVATGNRHFQIDLAWNASSDSGTGVSGYHLWRNGSIERTVVGGATSVTSLGTTPGSTYTYTVSAFDGANPANESAQSAPLLVTADPILATPSPPSGLVATALSSSSISLQWNASTPGGAALAGYLVVRDDHLIATVNAPTTTYVDTGLAAGSSHSYFVSAFGVNTEPNQSQPSNYAGATTLPGPVGTPAVPTGLRVSDQGAHQVLVNWNKSPDRASDGRLAYYNLYRNGAKILSDLAYGYSDIVPPGAQYSYTVSAFFPDTPAAESQQSAPVVITIPDDSTTRVIRINAGGPEYTDTSGNVWSADTFVSNGHTVDWGVHGISGTNDPTLYRTEAYGQMQYVLALAPGTYQVRLYFAENWVDSTFPNGGVGYRVFTVTANDVVIASNLDLFATAGHATAVIRSANVAVPTGRLTLQSPNGWTVNAIEITAVP